MAENIIQTGEFNQGEHPVNNDLSEANAFNERGIKKMEELKYEEGISEYKKAIELEPENPVFHLNLADSYAIIKDWDKAIEHFKNALKLDPDDDSILDNIAAVYSFKNDYKRAIKYSFEAIQLNPKPEYYAYLADNFRLDNNIEEAIDYYNEAISGGHESALVYNSLGVCYHTREENEKAISSYKRAIALDDQFDTCFTNLGLSYKIIKNWDKALEYYHTALEINPDSEEIFRELGEIYNEIQDWENALKYYEKFIEGNPDAADDITCNELGVAYLSVGDGKKAIEFFKRAMTVNPENYLYYANLADAYQFAGQVDKEIQNNLTAVEKMANGDGEFAGKDAIHNKLGMALLSLDENEQAVKHFQAAISLDPDNSTYHSNLAETYARYEKWDDAIEKYKDALAVKEDDAYSFSGLGSVNLFGKLKYHKAVELYEKAISILPDPEYYFLVATAYKKIGDLDNCIKNISIVRDKTRETDPEDRQYDILMGNAINDRGVQFFIAGKVKKAIKEYEAALELNPDNDVIYHNLYLAHSDLGNKKEAKFYLEEAIRINPDEILYAEDFEEFNLEI